MSALKNPSPSRNSTEFTASGGEKTREDALRGPPAPDICDSNREDLQSKYMTLISEMKSMRKALENKRHQDGARDKRQIKHLQSQLARHKETSARLVERLNQCNFVYMPPDMWPRRSPVCIAKTPTVISAVSEDWPTDTMNLA
jgi:hypothetical protein